jgi:hypothetical protein
MAYTCRQLVEAAFEEIGLASFSVDLQPDQLQSALRKLDMMMAEWNGKGIRLGYPIPSTALGNDLEASSNIPDSANNAVVTNLAVRLAPSYGKTVSMETKIAAKMGYDVLSARASKIPEYSISGMMPRGAGNKPWKNDTFVTPADDPLLVGNDGELELY